MKERISEIQWLELKISEMKQETEEDDSTTLATKADELDKLRYEMETILQRFIYIKKKKLQSEENLITASNLHQ